MMTKKDYVKFADMVAERKASWKRLPDKSNIIKNSILNEIELIQDDMIQLFQSDNSNFDAIQFNRHIENKVKQILDNVQ